MHLRDDKRGNTIFIVQKLRACLGNTHTVCCLQRTEIQAYVEQHFIR